MGFTQAIASCLKNYVGFNGRAPRSEYWYWVLVVIVLSIITQALDYVILEGETRLGPINAIFSLVAFLPGLAVAIRRLHDIDRTGWWFLIAFTIFGLVLLFVWACTRGTVGPNRFGPDPLGGALNQPAAA